MFGRQDVQRTGILEPGLRSIRFLTAAHRLRNTVPLAIRCLTRQTPVWPRAERQSQRMNGSLCCMSSTRPIDDIPDRRDHEIGLVEMDPVAALAGDDVTAVW